MAKLPKMIKAITAIILFFFVLSRIIIFSYSSVYPSREFHNWGILLVLGYGSPIGVRNEGTYEHKLALFASCLKL